MKKCPACGFENDAEHPTCVFCNVSIVDVPNHVSSSPGRGEIEREENRAIRQRILRNRLRFADGCYIASITLTAVLLGGVLRPEVLLFYGATAMTVAIGNHRGWVGQPRISFLQGAGSISLLVRFGPIQPLIFLMLVTHATLAALYWHWTNLLYDQQR